MSDFAAISCQLIEYYNERYVSNNNDCSLKPNFQLMGEASSFTRCSDSSKLVDDENKNLGCSPNEMESPQPLVLVLPFHRVGKALALGVGPPWIHMQLKAILLGKVVTAWTGKQKRVAQVIPIVKRAAIFVPIKQALIRPSFPRSVRYLIAVVPGAITTVIRPWVSQGAVCNISLLHHQHKQHKDAKHGLANAWTADHQNAPNRSIGRQRVHDCVVEIPMHLSDVQPMEQACPKHCLGGLQHSPHFSLKQFVRTDGQSDQLTRTIDGDVFRSLPCITWPHVTFRRHCHNERIFFVLATINQSSGRSQRLPLLRVERRPVREDGEIGRINVGDSDRTLEFHCISECIAVVHLYLHRADARQRPAVLAHELEPFPLISSRNSHETNSTEFEAQCRGVTKKDMKFNEVLPKNQVDPETHKVKADGELLTYVDRPSRDPGQEREDRVTHGVMDTLVAVTRVDKEITDKKQRNVELPFQIEDAAISDALDVLSYSILLPAIY